LRLGIAPERGGLNSSGFFIPEWRKDLSGRTQPAERKEVCRGPVNFTKRLSKPLMPLAKRQATELCSLAVR